MSLCMTPFDSRQSNACSSCHMYALMAKQGIFSLALQWWQRFQGCNSMVKKSLASSQLQCTQWMVTMLGWERCFKSTISRSAFMGIPSSSCRNFIFFIATCLFNLWSTTSCTAPNVPYPNFLTFSYLFCFFTIFTLFTHTTTTLYMIRNILGFYPFSNEFYAIAVQRVIQALSLNANVNDLEIEIKYARLVHFWQNKNKGESNEANMLHTCLCVLSSQTILNLNPLGQHIYRLNAGFEEHIHHKFYHIREFFHKLTLANHKKTKIKHDHVMSIYQELSLNAKNSEFKMLDLNEIRLDLYPLKLAGRYSYTAKSGWKKVKKILEFRNQLDFMMCERTFRLAINKEIEQDASPQQIEEVIELLRQKPTTVTIRLKNTMRVAKRYSQISLSEIYTPKDWRSPMPDLADNIKSSTLKQYLIKKFLLFYSVLSQEQTAFEVQSQFTKDGLRRLQQIAKKNARSQMKEQLQIAIGDLYALYFTDHATKKKQLTWFTQGEMPQARLENEYGNYMRSLLYEKMNENH